MAGAFLGGGRRLESWRKRTAGNIKGPELLNKYVGETERHIRLVFQRAREEASKGMPVIVFFDEMDSIFRTRGSGVSSDVENTIVPQLLSEIDGVEGLENVIVIGASNREDMIDPAILRPGRLDVKIKIEFFPQKDGRIMTVISPSVAGDIEVRPDTLPAAGDDSMRRLVAAWLLGYESRATRRNYGLDLAAWLDFCDRHGLDPMQARRPHVDAWARTLQAK
jgi:hypothetical protein